MVHADEVCGCRDPNMPSDRLSMLKDFDGSDPSKLIYVSIKGTIFDVNAKAHVYGSGKSYNILAGKDGSSESDGSHCGECAQSDQLHESNRTKGRAAVDATAALPLI
ncbi:hypothetical protein B0H19DRAFT_1086381 [Mycena capillaripes]|nr:hypothetical protein B0H19DRAFT_1086381 [Mycena capillaripes]